MCRMENITTAFMEQMSYDGCRLLTFGFKGNSFYALHHHYGGDQADDYYGLAVVDDVPEDSSANSIARFLEENEACGWSVAGSLKQVMEELMYFLMEGVI